MSMQGSELLAMFEGFQKTEERSNLFPKCELMYTSIMSNLNTITVYVYIYKE